MSNARSPRSACSTTVGTSWLDIGVHFPVGRGTMATFRLPTQRPYRRSGGTATIGCREERDEGVEVHEQTIEAPPADVWGFMVDPAALSAWFGADAWLEPVVGGPVLFRFADGSVRRGVVEQVERSHMLTWRWREHRGAGFGMELGESSQRHDRARARRRRARSCASPRSPADGDGGRVVSRTDPDPVFEALADPTRRAMMRALAEEGPVDAERAVAPAADHTAGRRQASRRACRTPGSSPARGPVRGRVYTFTPRPLSDAMDWMVDVGAGWDERLNA